MGIDQKEKVTTDRNVNKTCKTMTKGKLKSRSQMDRHMGWLQQDLMYRYIAIIFWFL